MQKTTRRAAGASLVAVGVVLGLVSAGPLGWGLGAVMAAVAFATGATLLGAPARPYDHVKDGI